VTREMTGDSGTCNAIPEYSANVSVMQSVRIGARLAWYLVWHPREIARLPRWLPRRPLSAMVLRTPWWPYDAVTWVAGNLPPYARVFEYGGGGSTLWLQDRGATVTVAEHSAAWHQRLSEASLSGTKVILRATEPTGRIVSAVEPGCFDGYVAAIDQEPADSLDLVIVDGRARVACVRRAMPKVKRGGLLLLDDTHRARYEPAIAILAGWERHVFQGLKPGDVSLTQTSVWRRPTE
jgi:hypothetical protein